MSLNILQASERSYKSLIKNPSSPLPLPQRGSGRGLGEKVRAALTPSPFPALRERGDLGRKRGIVASRRIAPAPLISPPSAPAAWERKGARGKVRASPAAWERKGARGEGKGGACTIHALALHDYQLAFTIDNTRMLAIHTGGVCAS